MEFKDKLKNLRLKRCMTQKELAELLYVTRSAVAKWENGLGMPNEDSFNKLCEIFNVEKEDLLTDKIEEAYINKNRQISKQKKIIISLVSLSVVLIVSVIVLIIFLSTKPKYVTLTTPEGKLNGIVSNYKSTDKIVNLKDYKEQSYIIVSNNPVISDKETIKSLNSVDKTNSYIFESSNLYDYNYSVGYSYLDSDYNYIKKDEKMKYDNFINDLYDKKSWYEDDKVFNATVDKTTHKFALPDSEYMIVVSIVADMKFEVEDTIIIQKFYYIFLVK